MRPQELSLLVVFNAIMREGSITQAAEHLSMTQPAVSNAVARMRVMWKDEVFIRHGRNIQPTMFSTNLWTKVRTPLRELSNAIDPVIFDPSTSTRTFHIGAADLLIELAWPDLRKVIEAQSPNVNIYAHPYMINNGSQMLADSEVDLTIGAFGMMASENFGTEFLYQTRLICIMRQGHPLQNKKLTLEKFTQAEHLLVSLSGDTQGPTDRELAKQGLTRRVAMTVNHFSAVAQIIRSTDLITVIPAHAVMSDLSDGLLHACHPPIELEPVSIRGFWHKRQEADPGLIWLRKQVRLIVTSKTEIYNRQIDEWLNNSV